MVPSNRRSVERAVRSVPCPLVARGVSRWHVHAVADRAPLLAALRFLVSLRFPVLWLRFCALTPDLAVAGPRLLVLGRGRGRGGPVAPKSAAPKPLNLPSLAKENQGVDPLSIILPAGAGATWASTSSADGESGPQPSARTLERV